MMSENKLDDGVQKSSEHDTPAGKKDNRVLLDSAARASGSPKAREPIVLDRRSGWLEWRGQRITLFDPGIQLDATHRAFFDEVGAGAGNFLYLAGLRCSSAWTALSHGKEPIQRFRDGLTMLGDMGHGDFQLASYSSDFSRARVIASGSVEAWSQKSRRTSSPRPYCHHARGLLAGLWDACIASVITPPADLTVWESTCVAAGQHECRFEIGSASLLRDLGLADPGDTHAIRWEMLEISKRLRSSNQRLSEVEQELAERQRAYQHLLNNMNDMLLVLDDQKKLVYVNSRFLDSAGLTFEEAIGTSPLSRIAEEDREKVEAVYDSLLKSEVATATYSFRVHRPTGVITIESSAKRMELRNGRLGIEILGRDVTERERARHELEAANSALLRKQRIADYDLQVAKRVHESLLPKRVRRRGIRIDTKYVPAERVGGDYGQLHFQGDQNVLLAVSDVSGHGMASALLAARVSSQVQTLCQAGADPLELTVGVNEFLREYFPDTGLFVTFLAVQIDLSAQTLQYCGAGHPGAILWRREQDTLDVLASQHLPLGIVDDFLREPGFEVLSWKPGDRLFLYTDGVTDTHDPSGEPLRIEGLTRLIRMTRTMPIFDVGDWLLRELNQFRRGPTVDDVTLVIAELGEPAT